MEDEPHAVVKLLLARMESHPAEFTRSIESRWYDIVGEIRTWGNETDKAAINAKLRDIRLGEAHEDAMDELCNGPERRRMQEEEAEYERQLIIKQGKNLTQAVLDEYANTNQLLKGTLSSDMDPFAGSTYTSPFDSIRQALGIKK